MSKNVKLMIALGAAVAVGSGATAMLLSGGESWFTSPLYAELYEDSYIGDDRQVIGDFNGDDYADFAIFRQWGQGGTIYLWVYAGDGTGQFSLVQEYQNQNSGFTLISNENSWQETSDVNGDGYLDLLIQVHPKGGQAHESLFSTLIFLNNNGNGFVCAGDINGNGETEIDDLLQLIGDFGCTEGDPLN